MNDSKIHALVSLYKFCLRTLLIDYFTFADSNDNVLYTPIPGMDSVMEGLRPSTPEVSEEDPTVTEETLEPRLPSGREGEEHLRRHPPQQNGG